MLNITTADGFTTADLSAAIMRSPAKPGLITGLKLFTPKYVNSPNVVVEEKSGGLALVPNTPRGSGGTPVSKDKRKLRSLICTHLQQNSDILADSLIGRRAFGEENENERLSDRVAEEQEKHRAQIDITLERMYASALQGILLDHDGSTIYNFYTEFGLAQPTKSFVLGTSTTKVKKFILECNREIETGLGAVGKDELNLALCGPEWFDAFVNHDQVQYAYQNYLEGKFLRDDPRKGFEFCGVLWREYNANVGGAPFIPTNQAQLFPTGVTDMLICNFAPADYNECVGADGQEYYSKLETMKFDKGYEVESQSNPLPVNTRPNVSWKLTL